MDKPGVCADKLRLSTSALSFEVQGFEDEAAASSAVPSPRICTAARQLSAVVEDHMRPGDETAGMHSAQYSRQQQHRSAGSQRLSCVRNTGQHLRLNAAQTDQIMQRRHAQTLFAAQHRCRLLLSTAAVCCSAHRIGHVSSGHTTLFLMLPNPQHLSSTSSCRQMHAVTMLVVDATGVAAQPLQRGPHTTRQQHMQRHQQQGVQETAVQAGQEAPPQVNKWQARATHTVSQLLSYPSQRIIVLCSKSSPTLGGCRQPHRLQRSICASGNCFNKDHICALITVALQPAVAAMCLGISGVTAISI